MRLSRCTRKKLHAFIRPCSLLSPSVSIRMSNLEEEIIIPPDSKRLRYDDNVENQNQDRLSDLPDCVLIHILQLLQFLEPKDSVRTCILSTRFKHLWKRITSLVLYSSDFSTLENFTKFVSRFLSLRDHSFSLSCLSFSIEGSIELPLLNSFLKYIISHNIQRLGLCLNCEIEQIPSIFSCQTLTYLSLYIGGKGSGRTLFPKYLNLPALTHLCLSLFAFCADNDVADPFLTFKKLDRLHLYQCDVKDALTLRISSSTLTHLSMSYDCPITFEIVELCTPSLYTFVFTGTPHMNRFKGSNLSSVKHVDIDAYFYLECDDLAFNLFTWLQNFVGIESLVLTASTLQVLSFIPDLLQYKLPFLKNLKSLKVLDQELSVSLCLNLMLTKLQKAKSVSLEEACKLLNEGEKKMIRSFTRSPPLPDGIVDFLLQNSPSVEADILDLSRYPIVRRTMDTSS